MKNRNKVYIKSFDLYDKSSYEDIALIGKALESIDRIKIMDLISRKQYTLSQLSNELYLTPSSVAFHLKILLDAGLIETEPIPNKKTVRYTYTRSPSLLINLRKVTEYRGENEPYRVSIPIGQYSDIELDEDGKIKDADKIVNSIKEDWSEFIVTETTKGADTETPPNNTGGKMTKEEIMKIKDSNERQKAISENHELFGY